MSAKHRRGGETPVDWAVLAAMALTAAAAGVLVELIRKFLIR
jgi:hypothetical protein